MARLADAARFPAAHDHGMTKRTARIVLGVLAVVLPLTLVADPADAAGRGRKSGETQRDF